MKPVPIEVGHDPATWAFYWGCLRAEPIYTMVYKRKWCSGWTVWLHNGSKWQVLTETGWRMIQSPLR